ncbi:MAG: aminopeptidase P family protein [Thermoleophilaceae bacterium]|nr:aminopeptidase P family protein [Thermoleophilaceae bacterium]
MSAVPTATRADRLAELLGERELDSLLVTDLVNVRYLTGFTGTNGACVVTPEKRLFLTDFRYVAQAEEQVRDFDRLPAGREPANDLAEHLEGRAGFDDANMTVRTHGRLAGKVGEGVELVAAGGLVERLREVKDGNELDRIGEAAKLATAALEQMLEHGLAGRTERAFARELEQALRDAGAEDPSFPAIVAAGPHGALPHAEPRDVEIPRCALVVIDWGARLDGYCSDCTRTIATGELDGAAEEVYELVRRAQAEALAAVRAGAEQRAVDGVARGIIDQAGHDEHFGHGLGHGVGLEVHEGPRLTKQAEGELAAGNVVSVEPGVYLPGELGVRIEDLVAVTEDGADVLTSFPKTLTVVG